MVKLSETEGGADVWRGLLYRALSDSTCIIDGGWRGGTGCFEVRAERVERDQGCGSEWQTCVLQIGAELREDEAQHTLTADVRRTRTTPAQTSLSITPEMSAAVKLSFH